MSEEQFPFPSREKIREVELDGLVYHILRESILYKHEKEKGYTFSNDDSLVAVYGEQIGHISYAGGSDVGEIKLIGVVNEHEGEGFGEWLARYAFSELSKRGVTRVALNARAFSKADQFWLHLGQKKDFPYSIRPRTDEDDDVPYDKLLIVGPQLIAELKKKIKLYKDIDYPEDSKEVSQNIVDILTSEEPSSLRQGYYDEDLERQETRSFGINYGTRKGDSSPVLRGFESEGTLYEIDSENNQLVLQPTHSQLFYDEDKIPVRNQFVFEGAIDEVLQEFINKGYQVRPNEEEGR